MSSEQKFEFTKKNIDTYLKAVAKEYRKQVGRGMPAEMILIGGASVLVNYGFREMTIDINALFQAASSMNDAIGRVGDLYDLPHGWLNADFKKTESYSPRLVQFSRYYKTYSNVLSIRTISAEYLIAMKLRSGRQYKSDLSDVLGILAEHEKRGTPLHWSRFRRRFPICTEIGAACRIPISPSLKMSCRTDDLRSYTPKRSSASRKRKTSWFTLRKITPA